MKGEFRWLAAAVGIMCSITAIAATSNLPDHLYVLSWRRGAEALTDDSLAARIDPTAADVFYGSSVFPEANSVTFNVTPPKGEKLVGYWYSTVLADVDVGRSEPAGTSVECNGKTSFVWNGSKSGETFYYLALDFDWISYQVNYNGNGGSGTTPSTVKYVYTNEFALLESPFTRTGHTFAGWSYSSWTSPRAAGTQVSGADFELANHDDSAVVTLTAQWQANAYQLKFDANGGGGTMANQTMTYGQSAAISRCTFTRTGYTFDGWAKSADGARTYSDEASVKNLTDENGKVITLYARWKANTYTVSYLPGAEVATGSMSDKTCTYGVSYALDDNQFKRPGWTFTGWKDGQGNSYRDRHPFSNLTSVNGATITMTAQWQADTWKVQFYRDAAGSQLVGEKSVVTEGEMPALDAATYDLSAPSAAVVFGGYADSTGTLYYDAQLNRQVAKLPAAADLQLFAVWKEAQRYLRFDGNGADSGAMAVLEFAGAATNTLPANTYLRTGYAFGGWAALNTATTVRFEDKARVAWDELDVSHGETQLVYAVWQPIGYTLKFVPGEAGVTLNVGNINAVYGETVQLPECSYEDPSGKWNFNCWLGPDGQRHAPGDSVSNLVTTAGAIVEFTAMFTRSPTAFSRAMEIENLYWEPDAGATWGVLEAEGAGDGNNSAVTNKVTVAKTGGKPDPNSIVTEVSGNGVLHFRWRVLNLKKGTAETVLQAKDAARETIWACTNSVAAGDSEWRDFSAVVPPNPAIVRLCLQIQAFHSVSAVAGSPVFYFDKMSWQPGATIEQPTPSDATTVASLTAGGDGKWNLTAASSDRRFDYVLYGTDDLSKPLSEWNAIKRLEGTGEALSFEIPADATAPAKFFTVATEAKQ